MATIKKASIKNSISFFTFLFFLFLIVSSLLKIDLIQATEPIIINVQEIEIGQNNLSIGCQIDELGIKEFQDNLNRQQIVIDANFVLIRVFDWRDWENTSIDIDPCISWNDTTRTGDFNWTNLDNLVYSIYNVGAEPLFCLGAYSTIRSSCLPYIPNGMNLDEHLEGEYLPDPESFAAYCKEWVRHFKEKGLPVKYYEIWNEPFTVVFDEWNKPNPLRLEKYFNLYEKCYSEMKKENSDILISNDCSTFTTFLDYWVNNSGSFDYLSFHKYDSFTADQNDTDIYRDDAEMFIRAEESKWITNTTKYPGYYGLGDAKQIWKEATGEELPMILSEFNFNSAWITGTDPRIQHITGAVWTSLVLRKAILEGVQNTIYFTLASNSSKYQSYDTKGYGFGLVDSSTEKLWYPYYVHQMIGNNLAKGDTLYNTTASSSDVKTLAWRHESKTYMLLINKSNMTLNLEVNFGKHDETLNIQWIDNTDSEIQQTLSSNSQVEMQGYTVMLITLPLIIPEFSSIPIISFMIVATFLAAVFCYYLKKSIF